MSDKKLKMTDFDKAKVGYDKLAEYEKKIWNEAIEEATKTAIHSIGYETQSPLAYHVAFEIRKLKK